MRIWNADGGEVGACGNAARCVGWLAMEALSLDHARIATSTGWLEADRAGERRVTVDMGPPRLGWRDIPLAREMDTVKLDIAAGPDLVGPGCVSMGNPHVVFFVPDLDFAPVTRAGPLMEHHPLFPQRANVGFVQVIEPGRLRARVWERGAGLTQACGTGACAAVVAGHRQGLCDRACVVQLDGGDLDIHWSLKDDHVRMTGPVSLEFTGRLPSLESLS
jgi:diaminopimelate epimerase